MSGQFHPMRSHAQSSMMCVFSDGSDNQIRVIMPCHIIAVCRAMIPSHFVLVLDSRQFSRPSFFGGAEKVRYDDWRFPRVARITAVDPSFQTVATEVA